MSVKTMPEKDVEKILKRIAEHVRGIASRHDDPRQNKVIHEVAAVLENMTAGGLRYQLLKVPVEML